jgi:pSer/pThr/pTyr-binding forkhead associated (FHA) protein
MTGPTAPHSSTPREIKDRFEAERSGHPFLIYRDGEGKQQLVMLSPDRRKLTVGRLVGTDVPLGFDPEVSRLHAEFERVAGEWTVCDDGLSRNGTFVNGERILHRKRLQDGDAVAFGNTIVLYRCPTEESVKSTAAPSTREWERLLTDTQRKVLVALARPYRDSTYARPAGNQEMAEELHLSLDAIKAHLRAMYRIVGIEELPQNAKRSALVRLAIERGIIAPRDLWSRPGR